MEKRYLIITLPIEDHIKSVQSQLESVLSITNFEGLLNIKI